MGLASMSASSAKVAGALAAALDDTDPSVAFEAALTLRQRGWAERIGIPECDAVE